MPVTKPTKEKKPPTEKQIAAREAFAALRRKETVQEQPKEPQGMITQQALYTATQAQEQQPGSAYSTPIQLGEQTPTIIRHMEQKEETVASIKPYRTKRGEMIVDEGKMYEFELLTKHEEARPVDRKSGLPIGTGFQPSFSIPNRGSAWHKGNSKFENWRYIEGQPSCWVSEQPELDEYEPKDIERLLGNPENDLEFRDGRMLVAGGERGKLRLQAMYLSDYFVDNEKPRTPRPSSQQFKLNNPDAIVEEGNDLEDLAFATMTQARHCTTTEMLAVSALMGINIDDTTLAGLNRIKHQFLAKAKYDIHNPKAKEALEQFAAIINNPDTKRKYLVNQALLRGVLSTIQHPGKLTWAKLNAPILDLLGKLPPADELTARATDKEKVVVDLFAELEAQIK